MQKKRSKAIFLALWNFIKRNAIALSVTIIFFCVGEYWIIARQSGKLPFNEWLLLPLLPLVIMCGTGFWGDNG
jgi:hypothetical protein